MRISGLCTSPMVMDIESRQSRYRKSRDVTICGNSRPWFDRRTLAAGKVRARVLLPEQVLWTKEAYEYH
jgi:hypothetical protein